MDKAYDSRDRRRSLRARGIRAAVPERKRSGKRRRKGPKPKLYPEAHNDDFLGAKAVVVNRLTQQLLENFSADGVIDWAKLIEYNSGNIDIGKLDVRTMP